MPNEQYQALFGGERGGRPRDAARRSLEPTARRSSRRLLDATHGRRRRRSSAISAATTSRTSSARCGGARETHDRPTVIFAYTIKGYGLEIAGRPQNHSALLTRGADRRLALTSRPRRPRRVGRLRAPARRRQRCSPRRGERLDRATVGADAAPMPVPDDALDRDPAQDLDTGGLRPHPARPLARGRRRRAPRHRLARRLDLDQPRRLHQQGRRLGTGRGAGLRRDGGLAAEVARRADAASTSRWGSPR